MKNLLKIFLITIMVFMASMQTAYAQLTLLPSTDIDKETCVEMLGYYETDPTENVIPSNDLMACGIKTGRISLGMIPFFIRYFANFLLALIGLIAVLFIIIGGYFYIYGGLTEQKEKGKKFISNALLGMGIAILSWVIVNVIISLVTQ